MRQQWYKLQGHIPVPAEAGDVEIMSNKNRIVQQTTLPTEEFISTVFLGLDHNWGDDSEGPILFETMIFGGTHDQYQRRYRTWEEAEKGHQEAINLIYGIV